MVRTIKNIFTYISAWKSSNTGSYDIYVNNSYSTGASNTYSNDISVSDSSSCISRSSCIVEFLF